MTDRTQTLPTYEGAGTTKRILTPLTATPENDDEMTDIVERIAALKEREAICWAMSGVFLHAKDAHGLHDMGVEIQGIQWAIRELEAVT